MFRKVPALALCLGYAPRDVEDVTRRGIARFDRSTCRVSKFAEKLPLDEAQSELAAGALCVPTLYVFHASIIRHVTRFVEIQTLRGLGGTVATPRALGHFSLGRYVRVKKQFSFCCMTVYSVTLIRLLMIIF